MLSTVAKSMVMEISDSKNNSDPKKLIVEELEDTVGSGLTICITNRDGNVIAKSQTDAPESPASDGSNWRIHSVRLKNGEIAVVAVPWAKTRAALRSHVLTLAWLGSFVVLIASVGAWLLVGRTLTPISSLARQAHASSANSLALTLVSPSGDYEMVELVNTLNGLLQRITETTAAKGRFYSAASHELRTPLQALSGHLELALSKDRTLEEYRATVEEAYVQTRRLISLVRALLFLYQLDPSASLPARQPIDIVTVCNRLLGYFQPIIGERGLQISSKMPNEAEVLTPPDHFDMLIRNLLENACKYTPENGEIHLTIEVTNGSIHLEVLNDYPVSEDWNPEELFEPFVRPDVSRNFKTGGTGLGLAICKSIADVNGWDF